MIWIYSHSKGAVDLFDSAQEKTLHGSAIICYSDLAFICYSQQKTTALALQIPETLLKSLEEVALLLT